MGKLIHPTSGTWIRTHDLSGMSLLPRPQDQGFYHQSKGLTNACYIVYPTQSDVIGTSRSQLHHN